MDRQLQYALKNVFVMLGLCVFFAALTLAQTPTKEYIRLGGKVVAIEHPNSSGSETLTVNGPPMVVVGTQATFMTSTGVLATWIVSGGGTLSTNGPSASVVYTAPPAAGSITITATSAANPSISGQISFTVTTSVPFTIGGPSSMDMGIQATLTASQSVTWSTSAGVLSSNGPATSVTYTAPTPILSNQTVTITATSGGSSPATVTKTITIIATTPPPSNSPPVIILQNYNSAYGAIASPLFLIKNANGAANIDYIYLGIGSQSIYDYPWWSLCQLLYIRSQNKFQLYDSIQNTYVHEPPGQTLSNSYCIVTNPQLVPNMSDPQYVQVSATITAKGPLVGNSFEIGARAFDDSSWWSNNGAFTPVVNSWVIPGNQPPTVQSFSVPTGTTTTGTFTGVYRDTNGFENIDSVTTRITSSSGSNVNACVVSYAAYMKQFRLRNDWDGAWLYLANDTNATVSNSQCTLSRNGTSATGSGTDLTVTFKLTSTVAFTGAKTVKTSVNDIGRLTSADWPATWTTAALTVSGPASVITGMPATFNTSVPATWSVSYGGPVVPGSPATSATYTPASVTSNQTVTITATSIADPSLSGAFSFTVTPSQLVISGIVPQLNMGASTTLSTTQAVTWSILQGGGTLSSTSGSSTTYTAPKPVSSWQGVAIRATAIANPLLTATAEFVVIEPPFVTSPHPPVIVTGSGAAAASGDTVSIGFGVSDSGFDAKYVEIRVGSNGVYDFPWNELCHMTYDISTNSLKLYDSILGTYIQGWYGTPLQNSYCTVTNWQWTTPFPGYGEASSVTIVAKGPLAGTGREVGVRAYDAAGGWTVNGSSSNPDDFFPRVKPWIPMTNQLPTVQSFTPASGNGTTQAFTGVFRDPNGYPGIYTVRARFSSGPTDVNACIVSFSLPYKKFMLLNDAGDQWSVLEGSNTSSRSNSQCTLNRTGSSWSGSGTDLTVNWNITFKNTFFGSKGVVSSATDLADATSGDFPTTWTAGPIPVTITGPTTPMVMRAQASLLASVSSSWSVLSGGGTIAPSSGASTNATYTASQAISSPQVVTIKATSDANPLATGTYNLTVVPPTLSLGAVAPSSGSGSSQTFTVSATDNALFNSPNVHLWFTVGASASAAARCSVDYQPVVSTLTLYGNGGVGATSGTLGSNATLQNGQCSINLLSASASGSVGPTITLTLPVTFNASFVGARNVYVRLQDSGVVDTGDILKGTWSVPNQAPSIVVSPPLSLSGASGVVQMTMYDPNGTADLKTGSVLIGPDLSAYCYLRYEAGPQQLFAYDETFGWRGPISPGSTQTIDTPYCSVGAPTIGVSEPFLTVWIPVTAKPALAGASQKIYEFAVDQSNAYSDSGIPTQVGAWNVTGNQPPTISSFTPSSGSGKTVTFQGVYQDTNEFRNIKSVIYLINATFSNVNACLFYYERLTGTILLRNDADTDWRPPLGMGAGDSVSNSQCTISRTGTTASGSGNNLSLNFKVTFSSSFVGAKSLWQVVEDLGALSATTSSAWTVTN